MEIIYKWNLQDYEWEYFWWLDIVDNIFYIEDYNHWKINWKYSKKKNKYYAHKVINLWDEKWKFILFKNNYCIIWLTKKSEKQIDDLEFPDWRYPRLWL